MNNFKGDKRGGMYWHEGKPFVSVTQVLSVIDKPALRYWFGQQVYRAFLANPMLDEKTALAAPYAVSDKAKNRGSTVHSVIESYKTGQMLLDGLPDEFKGYYNAFLDWIAVVKPTLLEQEATVISTKYGYAGTLDMFVTINGLNYVVDAKTGKDIYPEAWLQTAAYKGALEELGTKVDGVAVLLLKENGSYRFEHTTDCVKKYEAFLACKTLWEGLNEELLKKLAV